MADVRRVAHLSTIDAYGRAEGSIDESAPLLRTGREYGDSKIEAEEVCQEFVKQGTCNLVYVDDLPERQSHSVPSGPTLLRTTLSKRKVVPPGTPGMKNDKRTTVIPGATSAGTTKVLVM